MEAMAKLAAIGAQMGATIKLDLTSDVTHLIVGSTDSAKYRYVAKSREDVKVLSPEWLEALREVWMTGDDDLDMAALEKEYRMPTLAGLRICLTGFDNPDQRKTIQESVDANGAEYHGDLTKSVTHLIAAAPSGKKYEHALNWRMKIVSLEWLEQSLERGMVLDEALYNPTMPVEERGQGAWDRKMPASPAIGKRTRDAEPSQALNPFRRKLRRSASTKVGSQSDAFWAGITAPSFERPIDEDEWTEEIVTKPDSTRTSTRTHTPASPHRHASVHENDSLIEAHLDDNADSHEPSLPPHANDVSQHDGIFEGRLVCTHGFDAEKTSILRQHLESNGAHVIHATDLNNAPSDDLRRGYLVIPHDVEVDSAALPGRAGEHMNLATNWWVERCLYGKRLVDPSDDVLSRPFEKLSISGFSGLTINSTGFSGIELLHVTKVVTLMGASYDEQLSAKTSVVICNPPTINTPKLKFATDKRIPTVHATWLWDCLRSGRLQSYAEYQLNKPAPPQPQKPKQRPQPQDDVPTALLSTEESLELRQKKQQPTNAVKTSLHPQQRGNLALTAPADATPASTTDEADTSNNDTNGLNYDDDESVIPGLDGAGSHPLQETSANSPRRPSTSPHASKSFSRPRSSSAESLIAPAPRKSKAGQIPDPVVPVPEPDSVIPADTEPVPQEVPKEKETIKAKGPEEEKDYSSILAQMRANRKTVPTSVDQAPGKTRKRRQLGRATSTRSNASAGDSSGNILAGEEEEEENTVLVEEYQPSQELGWDSPGAAKAREQMIKKLGGTMQEKSVAVEGIGVVKDVGGNTTGRAGRKRRG
ncbi:hypothetical protein J4E90_002102 [Alternaria incomplexa]|uniref:uncharacterized protein n=1 Tax=Alternaria incomplexa TaxID=1187928 RepID=UPI00222095E2|nr:uncharacterized protein J4E90_002102 [Alternaria incomplexa]KAI4919962.1 hypothetical protein J4E90_002102 [Alternaria incomplexa]